jgi:branched-chain amino acid transport system permease protein
VLAFGVSAAYAGIAGALYGVISLYVSPETFPITLSLYLVVGAVVGLFASIWGAILGALLVQFLPDIVDLIPHVNAKEGGPRTFFFGAILVAVMVLLPQLTRLGARVYSRSGS